MNVQAVANNVRVSPRKIRLIADAIRHLSVEDAFNLLQTTHKAASTPLTKVLKSAVANATNNAKLELTNLVIESIQINQGQAFKRFRPSTRGRIHPYKKRGSNITVVVTEKVVAKPVVKVTDDKKKLAAPKAEKKEKEAKK
jgi:large subunit ribosomal protein L22